jgi:hypothetical protein
MHLYLSWWRRPRPSTDTDTDSHGLWPAIFIPTSQARLDGFEFAISGDAKQALRVASPEINI